ncbi:GspE/PulE family protein [Bacillus thuringiensis]|uniref:GspE/PulE family protein n=1 Tax=Bacillus thuringiensis TaxID=1428 RepID=UPI0021D6772D|nr:GspE/PulE family protein [Bacillus thuringiensis]MCU7667080.1 type II/IV secretion system protein [Bacillus thuringiensis]
MKNRKLGEILIRTGKITEEQLKKALVYQKALKDNVSLDEILIKMNAVSQEDLSELYKIKKTEVTEVDEEELDAELIKKSPEKLLRDNYTIPLKIEDNHSILVVFAAEILDYKATDEFRRIYEVKKIETKIMSKEKIASMIDKMFTFGVGDEIEEYDEDDAEDIVSESSPIVKFVNDLFSRAINMGVSDIHIEPQLNKNTRIRFRIDGELVEFTQIPKKWHNQVISRIKIMSNLDISKRYEPQDGELRVKHGESFMNLRISILPLAVGEKIVARVLAKADSLYSVSELGISNKNLILITDSIKKKQGLILVTGPTGSGKTTTMYAMLQEINSPGKNISTIEDPVELNVPGLNQVQVSKRITFTDSLRALLRQDPDVIMIGEVRDKETAEIAVRSSLTGHLVLSTLHTNNALATINRLIDMDIEPYLLSDALTLVVSQRLVKRLCPHCKSEDNEGLEYAHKKYGEKVISCKKIYKPNGCKECENKGFKGRIGIHEVLHVNDELKKFMVEKDLQGIRDYVKTNLMLEDAINKMSLGEIDLKEMEKIMLDF